MGTRTVLFNENSRKRNFFTYSRKEKDKEGETPIETLGRKMI